MDCLKNLVGVTTSDCACTVEGLSDAVKGELALSKSGLYTDDLPGGFSLRMMREFKDGCKDFADMALASVRAAERQIMDDLIVALSEQYKVGKRAFIGTIGRLSIAATLATQRPIQGLVLRAIEATDGVVILRSIKLAVNQAGTVKVYVAKSPVGEFNPEVIHTLEINTQMNIWAHGVIEAPGWTLPLRENGRMLEYYIYWDRTEAGGASPKDNDIRCGGCSSESNSALNDFLTVKGFAAEPNGWDRASTDNYGHGLALDAEVKCMPQLTVCDQFFHQPAIATALAHGVRFKAGEYIMEKVLNSGEINRFTLQGDNYILGKRNHFRLQAETRVLRVADDLDVSDSGCFQCGKNAPSYGKILS